MAKAQTKKSAKSATQTTTKTPAAEARATSTAEIGRAHV